MVTGKQGYIDVQDVELVDKSGEGGDVGTINDDAHIIDSQTGYEGEQKGDEGVIEGYQASQLTPAEVKHALADQQGNSDDRERTLEKRELVRGKNNFSWGLNNKVSVVIGIGGTKQDRKF